MNAEQFLISLSAVGDDPARISQLRKIAVALAINGKLGAPELRPPNYPKVREEELPADFNDSSRFTRLGAIARIEKGKTGIKQAVPGPFPLVVTGEERLSCDHFDFQEPAAIVPLVSSAGHGKASLNRLHYQEGQFALGTILAAVFPHDSGLITARFIFEYLSTFKDELLVSRMIGTANVSLSIGKVAEVPIPFVTRDAQRRLDELMALCDRLEAARAQREATRDRLTASTLARLNTPEPPASPDGDASKESSFQSDARFALKVLPALTTRPDQITRIRQTVLGLAFRGSLSPAGEWRNRPVRLGEVAALQNGYAFKSEWFTKVGVRLLRNANVGHGLLNWNEVVCLPTAQAREYERFRLIDGDVVLSLDRPFIATGTKVARVTADDLPALLLQRVGRFVLNPSLCAEYLFLWISSPDFSAQIDPGRSNGVPHISSKQVEAAKLLIPPLAEQHRIVAKVDELMALCDQLEASLSLGENTRSRLLNALLHEAFAPQALAA